MISRSQRILGLDIGSHSVKAVELTKAGDKFAVTGYGQSEIAATGTLKDAIMAVLREGHFKSKQVVSSVSGRSVIVRYINTPFMKPEDLKASMRFEADKYIPFDLNEVILDCVPLDDKPSPTGEMRVVVVAVKKEVVGEHVRLLQEAGLFPYIIDVDCFALGNAFELCGTPVEPVAAEAEKTEGAAAPEPAAQEATAEVSEEQPAVEAPAEDSGTGKAKHANVFALVDIGSQKTNINIVEGASSHFTREVYIGGADMTEAIAKHLGVSPEEAETAKRDGSREAEVLEAVAQTLDDLANEIFLSFDYFENQFDAEIKTVYLSGGGSRLKGINGALSQTLAREVKQWDPLSAYDVTLAGSQESKLRESAPQLAVALGLASRLRKV